MFKQVMVNNVINTNNHFSPQLTKYEKKRHTSRWKSRLSLGQAHKCGGIKLVNGIPTLHV
jgi:hypothetical protein